MKVEGFEVPQAVIDKLADASKVKRVFKAANLVDVIIKDVPSSPAGAIVTRIVDRFLQKERKANRIAFMNNEWHVLGSA